MRLVAVYNHDTMAQALRRWRYPFRWAVKDLKACACFEVQMENRLAVGYAWYQPVSETTVQMHMGLDPRNRHPLTRGIFGDMHKVPEIMGFDFVVAEQLTPKAERALRDLGWQDRGNGVLQAALPSTWAQYAKEA